MNGEARAATYSEDDLLPLSALQHLAYCERQCMLIHVEQAWAENRHTAAGRLLHERVHERQSGTRDGVPVARALRLASYRLGLSGVTDFVEFHPAAEHEPGIDLRGRSGRWVPFPVEYKRGRPKAHDADEVQLCAQAMCLEEMLSASIPAGALFYGKTRRRKEVRLDQALRSRVETCARRLHELVRAGRTPPPVCEKRKCKGCSLRSQCVPDRPASAAGYLRRMIARTLEGPQRDEDP